MTTIIVISQDSSVIIGPNDGSGGPDKSGEDSQSPKGPARSPMDPPKGPSKGPPQAPEEPRARRYNNSLSTVESDESSNPSSAASTLSSGNSLGLELPSGATQRPTESGTESGSRGTTAADSAFLSSPDSIEEGGGGSKGRRGRVAKPARRSLPRTLSFSSGSSSSIFITSPPAASAATSKDDSALLGSSRRSIERRVPEKEEVPPAPARYCSPANGPHGVKFYINSATGKADLKTTNGGEGLVTRSLGRIVEAPSLSVAEPPLEGDAGGGGVGGGVQSYCTENRKAKAAARAARKLPANFSIYSDIHDLQSLLRDVGLPCRCPSCHFH